MLDGYFEHKQDRAVRTAYLAFCLETLFGRYVLSLALVSGIPSLPSEFDGTSAV